MNRNLVGFLTGFAEKRTEQYDERNKKAEELQERLDAISLAGLETEQEQYDKVNPVLQNIKNNLDDGDLQSAFSKAVELGYGGQTASKLKSTLGKDGKYVFDDEEATYKSLYDIVNTGLSQERPELTAEYFDNLPQIRKKEQGFNRFLNGVLFGPDAIDEVVTTGFKGARDLYAPLAEKPITGARFEEKEEKVSWQLKEVPNKAGGTDYYAVHITNEGETVAIPAFSGKSPTVEKAKVPTKDERSLVFSRVDEFVNNDLKRRKDDTSAEALNKILSMSSKEGDPPTVGETLISNIYSGIKQQATDDTTLAELQDVTVSTLDYIAQFGLVETIDNGFFAKNSYVVKPSIKLQVGKKVTTVNTLDLGLFMSQYPNAVPYTQ